jgi:hypothetical protein
MLQFNFNKIKDNLTSNQWQAMKSVCIVAKTSHPTLIFGHTGDIRRSIANEIASHSKFASYGTSYFDCGVEYGSVPLTAGTIIIDNIDYASKSIQIRLQEYMDADKRGKGCIRFIFLSETNLEKKVETGKLMPGVFFNIIIFIDAEHVLL